MILTPANVQLIGQELAIAWTDGAESYLALELLRRACPCATCTGEPDVLGRGERPRGAGYRPASFELRSFQTVGGYALQPCWGDGHDTGLYSYAYLRQLSA